jgi:geranylgeranyl reductase family protein
MLKNIIIIGAGPIGCFTAQVLKIHGYKPLLIEEHNEVGRPIHCTGLVGSRVFSEKWPFSLPRSSILNVINGAVVYYDNQHFSVDREKVAYVVDRERFDKELSKGLDILYANKFLGVEKNNAHYVIETERDELFADIVIGADGANSLLRKAVNDNGSIRQYRGIQLRIKARPRYKDLVEVHLKESFFVWVVPETEDVIRVGTISENPYSDLNHFLTGSGIKGQILERFGGLVAVGICNNTVKDNIAIVGDAACQLKPLSYGGIYFGLKSASILAACIKDNKLNRYDSQWKKELASEIKIGLKIREAYNKFNNEELRRFFRILKKHKSLIERIGDFENHSRFILEILKNPSLYPRAADLFQVIFKTIF